MATCITPTIKLIPSNRDSVHLYAICVSRGPRQTRGEYVFCSGWNRKDCGTGSLCCMEASVVPVVYAVHYIHYIYANTSRPPPRLHVGGTESSSGKPLVAYAQACWNSIQYVVKITQFVRNRARGESDKLGPDFRHDSFATFPSDISPPRRELHRELKRSSRSNLVIIVAKFTSFRVHSGLTSSLVSRSLSSWLCRQNSGDRN